MPALAPEQEAREQIDEMLDASGWQVQTRQQMNRTAALGVAVCEFPLTTGEVDYMLFAQGKPIGVVEAKPAGTPLSGVEPQATSTVRACRICSVPWPGTIHCPFATSLPASKPTLPTTGP